MRRKEGRALADAILFKGFGLGGRGRRPRKRSVQKHPTSPSRRRGEGMYRGGKEKRKETQEPKQGEGEGRKLPFCGLGMRKEKFGQLNAKKAFGQMQGRG